MYNIYSMNVFSGALLSNLIEPVYLASVIVGSLYHSEHLTRAAYGRLSNSTITNQLPDGYRLNFPTLCGITCSEGRQTGRLPLSFTIKPVQKTCNKT